VHARHELNDQDSTSEWKRANPPLRTHDELRNGAWLLSVLHNWTDEAISDHLQLLAELMTQFRREWDREEEDRRRAVELEDEDEEDELDTGRYRVWKRRSLSLAP